MTMNLTKCPKWTTCHKVRISEDKNTKESICNKCMELNK